MQLARLALAYLSLFYYFLYSPQHNVTSIAIFVLFKLHLCRVLKLIDQANSSATRFGVEVVPIPRATVEDEPLAAL